MLLGVYAFAFQIYGDFAGYSNIARGTSKMMGIELIENFRFPYFVRTPQEFWRHWHISLSTWLRDYLYIPLGGSRGSEWHTRRNLLLTMVLGGLWHGAAWTFVIWGAVPRPAARRITAPRSAQARCGAWLLSPSHAACVCRLGGDVPRHVLRLADLPRPLGDQIGELARGLLFDFAPSTVDCRRCWRRCCSTPRRCWSCTPARRGSTTC